MKKFTIYFILVYLFIGLCYGMIGEIHLAKKYGNPLLSVFYDPYAYLRSVLFSAQWPIDMYFTWKHKVNNA